VRETLTKNSHFYPVIVAGGRGTRFWPLSRKRRAKQLLSLDGKKSMIQQTVARLRPLAAEKSFWVVTNEDLRTEILRHLPRVPKPQVLAEPLGRNTAPAIGLAAFILLNQDPRAVIGMFPADHVIGDEKRFRQTLQQGIGIASKADNIVVLGIKPTRPETGYGYIEGGKKDGGAQHVRRFTEKPNLQKAEEFVGAGNYFWNSGMFLWSARTLTDALREHLPETTPFLEQIADSYGSRNFEATFRKLYPRCENISIDYAVLEPRSAKGEQASNLFCLPADFGWNDLGSWAALYEFQAAGTNKDHAANVLNGNASFILDAARNYIHAPGKFVAAVGVNDLVVVETEDALLITTREHSQDVGKVVKHLDEKKLSKLV
jgi:mannose-1-phosphate guanylyltransferase